MNRRRFLGVAAAGVGAAGVVGVMARPWYMGRTTGTIGGARYYVERDRRIVDYQAYARGPYLLRGPDPGPLEDRNYVTYVGASQTFGVYAPEPFPARVSAALGVTHLNLGVGGAGPEFFTRRLDSLRRWLNRGRFVVLQVMSARSAGNSQMRQMRGKRHVLFRGRNVTTEVAWAEILADPGMTPGRVWALVDETRADWQRFYELLLDAIEVPVLLLTIATQPPIDRENRSVMPASVEALFGPPPQLVTRDMIGTLATRCATYVECITSVGLPQTLRDRFTGEVLGTDSYYPSPEMHEEVARRLIPACRDLWRD